MDGLLGGRSQQGGNEDSRTGKEGKKIKNKLMHDKHGPTGDPLRNWVESCHGRREGWGSYPQLSSCTGPPSPMEDEAQVLEVGCCQ